MTDLAELQDQIAELREQIKANPFHYDSHVALIGALRDAVAAASSAVDAASSPSSASASSSSEATAFAEQLLHARERMRETFPLSEDLWLAWINDEIRNAETLRPESDGAAAAHSRVNRLFELSSNDYLSVPIVRRRVQYTVASLHLDGLPEANQLAHARTVFEEGLKVAGRHFVTGKLLWDGYISFESYILDELEKSDDTEEEAITEQTERISTLFKRLIALPIAGVDTALCAEYVTFLEDNNLDDMDDVSVFANAKRDAGGLDPAVLQALAESQNKVAQITPYEQSLVDSEFPHLAEYSNYLQHEIDAGKPEQVVVLFERAIKDNCLVGDLWQLYLDYATKHLQPEAVEQIVSRALRNCPWISGLWVTRMLWLERSHSNIALVEEALESALLAGFSTPGDYLELWRCFIDIVRRQITPEVWDKLRADGIQPQQSASDAAQPEVTSSTPAYAGRGRGGWTTSTQAAAADDGLPPAVSKLFRTFERASAYLQQYFGENGDPYCSLLQYQINIQLYRLGNLTEARKLWKAIMKTSNCAYSAAMWIAYANFERTQAKNSQSAREAYQRGLQRDTLDDPNQLLSAWHEFEREESPSADAFAHVVQRCDTLRSKFNIRLARQLQQQQLREGRKLQQSAEKREKRRVDGGAEDNGLTALLSDARVKRQRDSDDAQAPRFTLPEKHAHDVSKDPVTVFVSNLDFKATEEMIRSQFEQIGNIVDVRLVRKPTGRSRGYGFVEFSSPEAAQKALALDRQPVLNRPMYVSPSVDKPKDGDGPAPSRYAQDGVDPKTLFVRNLSSLCRRDDLVTTFEKFAKVVDVRMTRHRDGRFTGRAYVEFANEEDAKLALAADGTVVRGQPISAQVCNPPTKAAASETPAQDNADSHAMPPPSSFGTARPDTFSKRPASTATTKSFVPRSLHAAPSRRLGLGFSSAKKPAADLSGPAASSSPASTATAMDTAPAQPAAASSASTTAPKSNSAFRDMFLNKKPSN
ncbi:hypothetical protein CAOG_01360 [Capsaspora owczarzaki ATCC 30864]|uniref:RRM domain-containing protein n=1 Tax=Capsaspora owczarzaki (strain ATCC 30864) TaxID=595528 RepID=A0A0D2VIZ9_CAPO3|nr:hypothetical protein CAOG_01360 [Capsaspora owczarzaki ATCC 30864]KJE89967.1 hypothetical protein CAOG_001360 [Capsaspora owczarzaki ATCC 30864]|eukprot:XP_004349880.1 hypothetical protein CAOG_01360 [Capsaspora owczarzaki ATCC 30864]